MRDHPSPPSALPVPTDPPVTVVEAAGTRIGVTSEGPDDAPALLAVHGVPGGAYDFRYLGPALAAHTRVHRLELPGFGAARDAPWKDHRPEGRGRVVLAAADALGLSRFAVLGHSMGGPAALAAASMAPERVSALVLVASVGLSRHRGMIWPPPMAAAVGELLRIPLLRDGAARVIRAGYRRSFPKAGPLTRREIRVHLQIVGGYDFAWARRAAPRVACPTIVAWADDDPQVEPRVGEELTAAIAGAHALRFATGGHNIQKSRAREIAEAIEALRGAGGARVTG
jgi:pimeloyl-ACP methyl ester carboxylesterase